MKKVFIAISFVSCFVIMACNDGSKTSESSKDSSVQNKTTSPSNFSNTIELTANDQLKYDKIELHVKANETVKLTLKKYWHYAQRVHGA